MWLGILKTKKDMLLHAPEGYEIVRNIFLNNILNINCTKKSFYFCICDINQLYQM